MNLLTFLPPVAAELEEYYGYRSERDDATPALPKTSALCETVQVLHERKELPDAAETIADLYGGSLPSISNERVEQIRKESPADLAAATIGMAHINAAYKTMSRFPERFTRRADDEEQWVYFGYHMEDWHRAFVSVRYYWNRRRRSAVAKRYGFHQAKSQVALGPISFMSEAAQKKGRPTAAEAAGADVEVVDFSDEDVEPSGGQTRGRHIKEATGTGKAKSKITAASRDAVKKYSAEIATLEEQLEKAVDLIVQEQLEDRKLELEGHMRWAADEDKAFDFPLLSEEDMEMVLDILRQHMGNVGKMDVPPLRDEDSDFVKEALDAIRGVDDRSEAAPQEASDGAKAGADAQPYYETLDATDLAMAMEDAIAAKRAAAHRAEYAAIDYLTTQGSKPEDVDMDVVASSLGLDTWENVPISRCEMAADQVYRPHQLAGEYSLPPCPRHSYCETTSTLKWCTRVEKGYTISNAPRPGT
jgi:hypothetical protein